MNEGTFKILGLTGAAFAVQAVLLFAFPTRDLSEPGPLLHSPTVALLDHENIPIQQAALLQDPTLFALPHKHGFSGQAWLVPKPMEHQPAQKMPEPIWLDQTGVTSTLAGVSQSAPQQMAFDTFLPPSFPRPPSPAPASYLEVRGPLKDIPLLAAPKLEPKFHTEILSNSVVQVAVGTNGFAYSTLLVGSSGLPSADKEALELARRVRFGKTSKSGGEDLAWGQLIFHWQALPPPATNATATPL